MPNIGFIYLILFQIADIKPQLYTCFSYIFYLYTHTVPPSATITPPSISVTEGNAVSIICEVQGSGPLVVTWSMSDGSPLPVGVQENGNTLFIASATNSHPGTYVCSVGNLAGSAQAEATLTVFCKRLLIVIYNDLGT